MTSILSAAVKPQDRSRITVVRMGRLPEGAEAAGRAERAQAAIRAAAEASPALRARAVAGWPRFVDTVEAYRGELLRIGCSSREADQLGHLIAGRDLLIYDDVPEAAALADEVGRFESFIDAARENRETGEGEECLLHLLSSTADLWRHGDRRTVAQVILEALAPVGGDFRKALEGLGLKLINSGDPDGRALMVANRHVGLFVDR